MIEEAVEMTLIRGKSWKIDVTQVAISLRSLETYIPQYRASLLLWKAVRGHLICEELENTLLSLCLMLSLIYSHRMLEILFAVLRTSRFYSLSALRSMLLSEVVLNLRRYYSNFLPRSL